jgi:hypothetical protein
VLNVDTDHPFPKSEQLDIVQIIQLGTQLLAMIGNIIVNITNLLNVGAVQLDPPPPDSFMMPRQKFMCNRQTATFTSL